MSVETEPLIRQYLDWVGANSTQRDVGAGWTELTLPYLDRHNDFLRVFVRELTGRLELTDDGKTIGELSDIGCDLKAGTRRREMARAILRGLGLSPDLVNSGKLEITAVNGEFPAKLHSLLMSMMAIDGLANASPANVASLFKEDVDKWLRLNQLRFRADEPFPGNSGAKYQYDFYLPMAGNRKDSVIHTLPKADKLHIQSFNYEVRDVRDKLGNDCPDFIAMFNDAAQPSQLNREKLLTSRIDPWVWSERNELAMKLTG